ncbi:MAG: beta-ketoacyl-[acyl-carrier-protein] synthase family protein [Candidatus Omnitrophica bacterium]|nr:beta-ketoacyl-[acyl-carrier-protein] synthase family protein [Candidatus Omnitrophota bacterium]MDD5352244.1 beta-ketoacyl-[acyl-carrier-protein] synthase family protein [Candidatus Omnitrophota bacterium]MDD5549842.1 beta-ketoacyl-[acyl-carrier-protein] synthase family protein [Candidatus Omnitrophota bacterium]
MKRVVITGLGVVSSIGIGKDEFWSNLIKGKSGISKIESFDTTGYPTQYGGEIKNFKSEEFINRRKVKSLGRASQLSIAAAKLALQDSHTEIKEIKNRNFGVCVGTTMGETQLMEEMDSTWIKSGEDKVKFSLVYSFPTNIISANLALELKVNGDNFMMPTACAAGNYCIGYGADIIRSSKETNIVLAGGTDAFSKVAYTGFNRLYAMAPEKCQPFDKNRKGMLLGEGAAILVLESLDSALQRKANIYAEILGYGLSCDAHHMTQPLEEGIAKCMLKAMNEAGIGAGDVDYISAHGTGTPQNDKIEVAALKKVFGKRYKKIPVSSIKSMLGHTMGAAAAMEAIACCLVLKEGILPPTINYEIPDPECDIDCVPNKARKQKVNIVLNNSYAFGGNNACLVLRKYNV